MNIGRFFKNLAYLCKVDLKKLNEKSQQTILHDQLHNILDNYKYEVISSINKLQFPNFKSIDDCFNELSSNHKSICRFGDGELNLINMKSIPFQKASPALSARLKEVLSSKNPNILIGIPATIYQSKENIYNHAKNFMRDFGKEFDITIREHTDSINQPLYPSEISLAYAHYIKYDFANYFKNLSSIWRNRDVTIICGKTIFDKIEHNIFDCAKSLDYQYAPSQNAFEEYNEILKQAMNIDKKRLVIVILGPTATVLAYDLALQGYQALDMGHIAKSYDWYVKECQTKNLDLANNFFSPD